MSDDYWLLPMVMCKAGGVHREIIDFLSSRNTSTRREEETVVVHQIMLQAADQAVSQGRGKLPVAAEKVLQDLKSRNEPTKTKAMQELRGVVELEARRISGEEFTGFINVLTQRIFDLVKSEDPSEKLGGIYAMDALVDVECEESSTFITRFANYLKTLLPCSHVPTMIMASTVMGHLVHAGGTLTAEFVEFMVKRALEGLNAEKRVEQQRLAGVLVLKQLAINAPTLFYMHVPPFVKAVWVPLRDSKQIIREGGIEALRACLSLIAQRDSNVRRRWFTAVFQEAERGLRSGHIDSIHGSLLVVGELLRLPQASMATAIEGGLAVVYDMMFRFKDHRAGMIRKTVVTILPLVASLDPELFRLTYAEQCFHHLTHALHKGSTPPPSTFEALAHLIQSADAELIRPWTSQILHLVHDGITPRPRKPFCTEALTCLSSLAAADRHSSTLQEQVLELLDHIFTSGEGRLSPVLIASLSEIASCMPLLTPDIQVKLLDAISFTLQRTPYQPSGTPNSRRIAPLRMMAASAESGPEAADRTEAVIEALKALSDFDFAGNQLSEFIRDCVAKYLDDHQPAVRLTAARTCCRLLLRPGAPLPKRSLSAVVVCQVLDQLLVTAVGDPEASIRLAVLKALGPQFDYFLSRAESIRSLFIAVHDEHFAVREAAMEKLGRLTLRNPSHVMPPMRKLLVQLLESLELGGEEKREKSSLLLGHVILASHSLIKPYVTPILHSILPKLCDPNPNVAANVLKTVGVLSRVGGPELVKFKDEIFPLMMEALQDQRSSTKRRVATRTLGLLVQHTGTAIQPYQSYPELLEMMLSRLKTEQAADIRLEHIKVMGILGAMDPHRLRSKPAAPRTAVLGLDKGKGEEGLPGPSSEEYYPTVTVTKLVKILKDQSLSSYHNMVIQALMFIFKTLGLKCVTLLPQIMQPILALVKSSQHGLRDFLFQQLGTLVAIVKQHIRPYLGRMFELMHEFWSHQGLQTQILFLVGEITLALKDEFKGYIPSLIPKMLEVLNHSTASSPATALKVLHVLELFDANLELYLHVTIPSVTALIEQDSARMEVRTAAILWLARTSRRLNLADYASRMLRPLARVLQSDAPMLHRPCVVALCSLTHSLQADMLLFAPLLAKALEKRRHVEGVARYEMLLDKIRRREPLSLDEAFPEEGALGGPAGDSEEPLHADAGRGQRINVNQSSLKRAWEVSHRSTKEDWSDWLRRFSVELLRESPSPALRSCAALAQVYHPLASELFNAAFVSCWAELFEQSRDSLMRNLEIAFSADRSPNVPPEVLQTLLALAEFMEHDEKPLPIDIRKLGAVAEKCQAYAKSLHYKEIEFLSSPATSIQSLISINNYLGLPEAANGLLVHAQKTLKMEMKESWYEKLHRWEEALDAYRARDAQEASVEAKEGCMRCLEALGEWESLQELAEQTWPVADSTAQRRIAPLAAGAALQVGRLEAMGRYAEAIDPKTVEGSLYRSILLVHTNQLEQAQKLITETRKLLDTQVTALVGESYERAYLAIVKTQQVAELEEVLTYKKAAHDPAGGGQELAYLRTMWNKRLFVVQGNVEVWQRIMATHSLLIPPEHNEVAWLKYAALCRKTHRLNLCERTLVRLIKLGDPHRPFTPFAQAVSPRVSLAWLKFLWANGQRESALGSLQEFVSSARGDRALQARAHLKVGLWTQELTSAASEQRFATILSSYRNATVLDKEWYKAWHQYALFNFEMVSHYEGQAAGDRAGRDRLAVAPYLVPAVHGFFRSIALQKNHIQQDILRLLTLWFKYGAWQDVEAALAEGFRALPIDTWLEVIPQIIARINAPNQRIRDAIHQLLLRIGKEHPQALVYPLTVASKSHSPDRRQQAENIFQHLQTFAPLLTQQAKLVSEELIRVAILWHEMWHEALEEASRLYFADHNVPGMLAVLKPMHDLMHKGPETKREISFQQQLGPELQEALEWCNKFQHSEQEKDLQRAWDLYYNVFRQINKQLPRMTHLELQLVSPNLLAAKSLQLAIPGLYRPGQPVVSIQAVEDTLTVITSKQRPRKCTMVGSDGKKYTYLLKGHEDLRQDERVMQLFGLVNTLLHNDRESSRRDLQIVRYNVIPLSPNSGLIEWVPACDTLHALVRDYRESRKILLNIEHRLMLAMAPDYDNLPLMGKVEVFQHALANTTGQDLNKVLWLKSNNSEDWLVRRTNYTRSLALMSMVGYVLGLGDRHPSNLMLHRHTGKMVHIDFGDCFEVAMQRDKFPEKIPFRLTRMLTNAMEVCGYEGTFRFTCQNVAALPCRILETMRESDVTVMRVLRDNKGSVMAMLEAFVHDPLINWRLFAPEARARPSANNAPVDHGRLSHAAAMMSGAANLDTQGGASSLYSSQGEYDHSLDDPPVPNVPSSVRPRYGSMHINRLEAQLEASDQDTAAEQLNEKAVKVISRVQNKLTGRDFDPEQVLDVDQQVEKLINQATSRENLCQCYVGWCPFW